MSIKAMNYVWEHSKAQGTARLVLLALADSCSDEGEWSPGIGSLAKKVNLSERQTQRCLRELETTGELRILKQQGMKTHSGNTNHYQMMIYRQINGIEEIPSGDIHDTPKSQAVTSMTPDAVTSMTPDAVTSMTPKPPVLTTNRPTKKKNLVAVSPQPARPPSPIIEPPTEKPEESPKALFVSESPPTPPHCEAPPAPRKRAKLPAHPGTRPILDAYTLAKERLEPGAVIHYAAEGVAARQLAEKGWTPESVVECFELMKRDGWWKEKSLRLASVASQIGAKLNGRRVDDYDPSKDKWYQGPYDGPAYDLDTIEITF